MLFVRPVLLENAKKRKPIPVMPQKKREEEQKKKRNEYRNTGRTSAQRPATVKWLKPSKRKEAPAGREGEKRKKMARCSSRRDGP